MDYSLLLGIHNCLSAKQGDLGIDPKHALTDDTFIPEDVTQTPVLPEGSPPNDNSYDFDSSFRAAAAAGDQGGGLTTATLSGSGGEDETTGDEVEGFAYGVEDSSGEVLLGAVKQQCSIAGSIPSLAELDLREDVYAILSDASNDFLCNCRQRQ
ncbi:uncharacterized protein LOC142350657 isoform X2 [Convolutriloba macropyga]|uniref:uncharacterized protein LOC142350657 isoform X2 n=1 Tax=Convolutriloba macropyga TaxID=536237 RepID=UPI003F528660